MHWEELACLATAPRFVRNHSVFEMSARKDVAQNVWLQRMNPVHLKGLRADCIRPVVMAFQIEETQQSQTLVRTDCCWENTLGGKDDSECRLPEVRYILHAHVTSISDNSDGIKAISQLVC